MAGSKPRSATLRLISELLDVPSPSGREEQLAGVVRKKVTAFGYSPETDGAGNVIVRIPGKRSKAAPMILAAHTDEIAMVITSVNHDGSLCADRSGGLHPWKLGETPVDIIGDQGTVQGVLSFGSTHRPDVKGPGGWRDWRILTGLSTAQLSRKGIRPGSTAAPVRAIRGPFEFGDPKDPLVAAWTFDDRAGVATLIRLLEAIKKQRVKPQYPTIIGFTVHEEGGCHGAKVLADRERPEFFVAVDGCPMPPEAPLTLDGTPGVWSKDTLVHFDQRVIKGLMTAARQAGTRLQPVVYSGAASDASYVYSTGGAPRVATVGIVRENSHGYEVTRVRVFDNLLKTLLQFVKTWK